jgi:hypothetical protein
MLKDYKLWKGEIQKEFNASDLSSNSTDDEESCDDSNSYHLHVQIKEVA